VCGVTGYQAPAGLDEAGPMLRKEAVTMKGKMALCTVLMSVVGMAGCAYETRITSSEPGPPVWVVRVPEDTAASKVFVGMGPADNILDEQNARNRAMEDVRDQIASSLKTEVVSEAIDIVKQKGAQHVGENVDEASYYAEVRSKVSQAMSGVRQDAYYWEKWKVKSGFFKASFIRYKYYVRANMPKELYEKLQTELAESIAAEIER